MEKVIALYIPFPDHFFHDARHLIEQLLQVTPSHRLGNRNVAQITTVSRLPTYEAPPPFEHGGDYVTAHGGGGEMAAALLLSTSLTGFAELKAHPFFANIDFDTLYDVTPPPARVVI
jgi:hypothetical protein